MNRQEKVVTCVHTWKYSERTVRNDTGSLIPYKERSCRKCSRTEAKVVPNYAKSYAPEFQPWDEEGDSR